MGKFFKKGLKYVLDFFSAGLSDMKKRKLQRISHKQSFTTKEANIIAVTDPIVIVIGYVKPTVNWRYTGRGDLRRGSELTRLTTIRSGGGHYGVEPQQSL